MKARPILFSGPMIRALLDGRKTQTRRVVKPLSMRHPIVNLAEHGDSGRGYSGRFNDPESWGFPYAEDGADMALADWPELCRYGRPGDLLWVRETWMDLLGTGIEHRNTPGGKLQRYAYGADSPAGSSSDECRKDFGLKWRPSIHMPRAASRLTLHITDLRVHRLLVENVPEFMDWGPCSITTGKPIPSRKGEYFRAWLDALRAIGFRLDYRVLCCADYGDPTTRQRFFLIGRSDRKALRWPEPSHTRGGAVDLLGRRAPWRAAAEIIDWSIRGTSIFTRKRPLKPNTVRRILAGAERYDWPAPYIAALRALLDGAEPRLDVTTDEAAPLLLNLRGTSEAHLQASARGVDGPLGTLTAGGTHVGLVMATGAGGVARLLDDPLPTVAATGHIQLAEPAVDGYRIDILYRMLHWRELARAMSFDDEGEEYQFAGTATDITKQIGNAVPGRTAKALIRALLE